ncbi:hypothetical protein BH11ACT5_BH11ACT5_06320 [soil metagenome]
MLLRPATAADLPEAAGVWGAAWHDGHDGHVAEELVAARTPEYFLSRISELLECTTIAVGDEGQILGVVIVVDDEFSQLAVADSGRRGGVGAALLAAAEEQVAAAGHGTIWLAVVEGNARARGFYERRGWTDEGPTVYRARSAGGAIPVPVQRYEKRLTVVAVESPRNVGVAELLRGGEAFAESLYPAEENFILPLEALEGADATVFVARVGGEALGMAALVQHGSDYELKRLFVSEAARGQGLAGLLLDALEEHARDAGAVVIRLETGNRSDAAIALYERRGYTHIPRFGEYADSASSVCMQLLLVE